MVAVMIGCVSVGRDVNTPIGRLGKAPHTFQTGIIASIQ